MRTADVQVLEALPPKTNSEGKPVRQEPRRLGRFRVQHETIDGMRGAAKSKAQSFLKGRPFSVNFGEFDPRRKQYTIYITCKAGK